MRRPALIAPPMLGAVAVVRAALDLLDWLARNAVTLQIEAQNEQAAGGALLRMP